MKGRRLIGGLQRLDQRLVAHLLAPAPISPNEKWGPALLPSPTAPRQVLPVFAPSENAVPKNDALIHPDPGAPAQASRRSQSAARSPELFPEHSREEPCDPSLVRPALPRLPIIRASPKTLAVDRSPRRFRSLSFRCRRPLPCGSDHLQRRSGPTPASRYDPGKPGSIRSATVCPFAALLGTFVFRAALTSSCELARLAAVRRTSLPAPLAGFAPEILRPAPIRHPGEARPSQNEFHSIALPAEIGVPVLPLPPLLRALEGEGRCPPIT